MTDGPYPLTPSQTAGPYLSIGLIDGPVTPHVVAPTDPRATRLRGLLLDGAGEPVTDGMVEVWQANAAGRYAHETDTRAELDLEDGFLGFARSSTVRDGWYELTVIKPGRVPWPGGGLQAPHLVVGVFSRGLLKRAVTRCYFPDEEEANREDPVLAGLASEAAATLVAAAEDGGLRLDIRLQGSGHTTFFAV